MSIRVMTWVWDHSNSRGTDRLVLLAIADAANDCGGDAWPSVPTLARKAGVDARTVQRSVRRLVELGELAVTSAAGEHGVNVYRVVMTPGRESPPAERHPRQSVTPTNPADAAEQPEHPRQSVTPGGAPPRQSATQTVLSVSTSTEEPQNTPSSAPRSNVTPIADETFTRFWAAYPRKVDKGHGRKAWAAAVKSGVDTAKVIAAAAEFAAACRTAGTEQRFIPYPATWLNGERYDDQPDPAGAGRAAVGGHQPFRNPPDMSAYEGRL